MPGESVPPLARDGPPPFSRSTSAAYTRCLAIAVEGEATEWVLTVADASDRTVEGVPCLWDP